jgi:hypothetical protein
VPLPVDQSLTSYATDVTGSPEPRLATPPLRELTPETSYGFDVIDFADAIGWPLDPWECNAVIRGGELVPDPSSPLGAPIPRFRFVLVIVARQNGKTLLCRVLVLYWMFIERHALILGTSTSRDTAKQSWREVIKMAESVDLLTSELPDVHVREQIGEEAFWTVDQATYRFAAPNRRAGRGSTLQRLILDELREHRTRDTYDAAINAGNAVLDFQAWAITNQGDATSIVLDELRDSALEFIETGRGDPALGLLEWSSPNGAKPTDPHALALANPNLGVRIPLAALMGQALTAERAGGETLARFRTEIMCQRVTLLDPAIDPDLWARCAVPVDAMIDLAEHRRAVALCLDVSLDGTHATLVAAAVVDGMVWLDVVRHWEGFGCTRALRADLPGLVNKIKPRALGWFPAGPAAAVAASITSGNGARQWPPRRVTVEEIKDETPAVCMGFAELVDTDQARHAGDPLLDAHVGQTQKLRRGDVWTFTRSGTGPVDGTYAAAGAAHLARILPAPLAPVTALA